ncbi:MAG: hypothetical protein JXA42_05295 [Anaerolineales bacterium]|nr:hypothetical protein [Anaerolineales bacterium]
MINQEIRIETANAARQNVSRLGFWFAILTALAAAAALGIAITTAPARSGPYCLVDFVGSCVTYPYTDVAAFVPTEYIWMVPAFLMAMLLVVVVVCIHHLVDADKRVFSQLALSFAVVAAAVHTINYFIQLAVIQPSLLKHELEGIALFSQYNPHGIFIALEDLGYLIMGVAFIFIAASIGQREKLDRAIRIIFYASSVLAIGSLIVLALIYGFELEYRYEVVAILVDWITLIVSGPFLGAFFRRAGRIGTI